ncbi:MAG: 4Fe-4S dicluster domain-containing protein [Patescibacteria group bacterium]
MKKPAALAAAVKRVARAAGADLVGIASVERYAGAPPEVHPASIFAGTRSVIALGCRMLRGTLKSIEEGRYWQAYNCDSYQYLNEVLAPHMLRRIVVFLEEMGYTSVPVHNPFGSHLGRPVRPGGPSPDGEISLRVAGCAAGLGELGLSKLLLTPQYGPRQRVFVVLTDAELRQDPLLAERVCDGCGACAAACPAGAIRLERRIEFGIGGRVFAHAEFDSDACLDVHQGWDARFSPFLDEGATRDKPPAYYQFLDRRFRHRSICGGRGCLRACLDHLEKKGALSSKYRLPMIEGEQWTLD